MKDTKGKLKSGSVSSTETEGVSAPPPKTAPTTAISLFHSSIKRARNLLDIHRVAHKTRELSQSSLADANRAAVVLAVSALDAYVRTLVVDKIVTNVANPTETVPEKLKNQIKDCLGQDSILEAARQGDLSSRIEKAFRNKFDDQSFQGVQKITEAMRLLGFEDIFSVIATAASVNEQNLKSDLGRFTKRRHIIAHCGDYDLTQTPPVEKAILKKDARSCIATVELVANEIDKLW